MYMSKIVNCVIDTLSKKERKKVIEFVLSRQGLNFVLSDFNGFELFVVSDGGAGWVGVACAKCMCDHGFKHFHSIKGFFDYHNSNE